MSPTRPTTLLPALAVTLALALGGCAPRTLPGTKIPDTDDTRALVSLLREYKKAVEAKDAAGVLAWVSESYQDDRGTRDPADDERYASLRERLPETMRRLDAVELDVSVREIDVEEDRARVVYFYTSRFRLPGLTEEVHTESDLEEMWLTREDGHWRITSGL